jgi:hypothetical protein
MTIDPADARAYYQAASTVLARLGPLVVPAHRTRDGTRIIRHIPAVFAPPWAAGLPLPVDGRQESQTVALADRGRMQREADHGAIEAAYRDRPRTQVYESIHARSDGWYGLVALHLAGLLRRRVVCTLYESRQDDRSLGAHDDAWWGVIMHMRGAKTWRLWPTGCGPYEITTRAGDVLLLPRGVTHEVTTPGGPGFPGHSVHLVYAVTDEPITDLI